MPIISVIVPVYNAERYLNRCVTSIINQTFQNFEVILIDDGSSDNSPHICDEWALKDERIRVIHTENGGASSARNIGLSDAKGEWIAFVDADDWLDLGALKILYGLATKYNTSLAIGGIKTIRGTVETTPQKNTVVRETLISQKDLLDRFFRVHGEPDVHSVNASIIRYDIINDYKFIEGKMNEDVETCYFLARTCKSAVLTNTILYYYYVNTNGVTNCSFSEKKLDLLEIWDIVRNQVEKYTPDYKDLCEINMKRARFTLLAHMYLKGYDKHNAHMKKIKKILKAEVKDSFGDLMRWKMPLSRKILLLAVIMLP